MKMKAIVTVTLKPSILDPQGEAVAHAPAKHGSQRGAVGPDWKTYRVGDRGG